MPFDWKFAWAIMPALLQGAVITIEATVLSFAVATILGLVFAIGRRSRIDAIRYSIIGFTEFVRSTPLLVQLYFLYFVLPLVGITFAPLLTGVIGLGVHYSCYTAEAYRAGLESVPKGQWEAAVALNYTRFEMFRRLILPQAIPPILPALGNYLIAMFKDTPLLAAITVMELMQTANLIASEKFLYVEPMTMVGLIFLFISLVASRALRYLERRMAK
jgi:polar amino acid transport system permease protein